MKVGHKGSDHVYLWYQCYVQRFAKGGSSPKAAIYRVIYLFKKTPSSGEGSFGVDTTTNNECKANARRKCHPGNRREKVRKDSGARGKRLVIQRATERPKAAIRAARPAMALTSERPAPELLVAVAAELWIEMIKLKNIGSLWWSTHAVLLPVELDVVLPGEVAVALPEVAVLLAVGSVPVKVTPYAKKNDYYKPGTRRV